MKYELKLHRVTFGMLTAMLIGFVVFLQRIHTGLADERLEAVASLAIVVVSAAIFVMMGVIEETIAFQFGWKHNRELWSYLLLGSLSLASGLYLAISETSSLQTVALAAAPHALIFGLAVLRIAQHMERHPAYRRALFLGGLVEIALGIALIIGSKLSNEGTDTLLGYVAIISILQLLPLLVYSPSVVPRPASMG